MNNNHDTLHRFLFKDAPIRGNLVNLNISYQQALQHQSMPDALKHALGELMAASAILTATLKMDGSLIMQLQSKGQLKLLVVECNADFGIRATAKWDGEIEADSSLFDLTEQGQFMITIDPKDGKQQPYQGIVPLEGDSIAKVLENYMYRSEQIDTKLWLSSDDNTASGLLIQKLPDTTNQTTLSSEQKADQLEMWNRLGILADTVTPEELNALDAQTLLTRLFNEEDIELFEPHNTHFFCSCSRHAVANMLRTLGEAEINSILEDEKVIDIHCDFCNQQYIFDEVDAQELILSEVERSPNKSQDNLH